jgi:hypothetical protein
MRDVPAGNGKEIIARPARIPAAGAGIGAG